MAKYRIFIGTYSKGQGKGLLSGAFDDETGEISLLDSVDIENPSYLQLSKDKNTLYGVSETDSFYGENGGGLFAVSLADEGQMRLVSAECTHGKSPCHLCLQDHFIFVSNYTEGSLSIFETAKNNKLMPSYTSVNHYGKGMDANRQEKSHIHFASMTPDGTYLTVCDLGLDQIFFYPYSSEKGLSVKANKIDCPAGSGPRHLVYSKDERYLYVLTELHNTVLVFKYHNGNAILLQEISSLPADFSGENSAAAIHISPDGDFLAASNRGHNSIAIFRIQSDGRLISTDFLRTGAEPRDFRYSPDGKWLLTANQRDGSVTIYQKCKTDHIFYETGKVSMPHPVCILFGDKNNL